MCLEDVFRGMNGLHFVGLFLCMAIIGGVVGVWLEEVINGSN